MPPSRGKKARKDYEPRSLQVSGLIFVGKKWYGPGRPLKNSRKWGHFHHFSAAPPSTPTSHVSGQRLVEGPKATVYPLGCRAKLPHPLRLASCNIWTCSVLKNKTWLGGGFNPFAKIFVKLCQIWSVKTSVFWNEGISHQNMNKMNGCSAGNYPFWGVHHVL